MRPFPTDANGRKQVWTHMQLHMPTAVDLMNTLKSQGITSKVVRYECGDMSFGDASEDKLPSWQVDAALIERVAAERRAAEEASKPKPKPKGKRK